jgi:hypothetical protein
VTRGAGAAVSDVDLYVREGSRFVRADEARPARRARTLPPIPTPVPVLEVAGDPSIPTAANPVVQVSPGVHRVFAPKCPHGHFARWAAAHDPKSGKANCTPCERSTR